MNAFGALAFIGVVQCGETGRIEFRTIGQTNGPSDGRNRNRGPLLEGFCFIREPKDYNLLKEKDGRHSGRLGHLDSTRAISKI